MDAFLTLIVLSFLFFIGAVVIVKYITGKTYEETMRICIGFVKRMGGAFYKEMTAPSPAPITKYPVFIGIDEYGYPIPRFMREYFSPFMKFYEIVDFDKTDYINANQNVIYYRLNCVRLKLDISGNELVDLLQSVAESCLRSHLRDCGYDNVPVKQIVAARPTNGMIIIYIACTSNGIPEINRIRKKINEINSKGNGPSAPPLVYTGWEDK